MSTKRTFDLTAVLDEAKAGKLRGSALRKTIKLAEDFGKTDAADELRLYLVDPTGFAGDNAPPEVRERVAQGISALTAMGNTLGRTRPMLKKYGVIGTLNRIAANQAASQNFDKLRKANLLHLTAEAIILDFPDLFDPKAVEVAQKRICEVKA